MITNKKAKFGEFGGQYVPEAVMQALIELENEFNRAKNDEQFLEEYHYYLRDMMDVPLHFTMQRI